MIKANELRLGNYLLDHLGRSLKVSRIGDEYLLVKLSNGVRLKYHINTFKPILLTEETLLKCGFKRNTRYKYSKKHYGWLQILLHEDGITIWVSNLRLDDIKYLHELQNIFYTLTKTELEVNL